MHGPACGAPWVEDPGLAPPASPVDSCRPGPPPAEPAAKINSFYLQEMNCSDQGRPPQELAGGSSRLLPEGTAPSRPSRLCQGEGFREEGRIEKHNKTSKTRARQGVSGKPGLQETRSASAGVALPREGGELPPEEEPASALGERDMK